MAIKIPTDQQIRELDQFTIQSEPIRSEDLMWRAAKAFVKEFSKAYPQRNHTIHIICGMGNNGGDGLCIGILLKDLNYSVNVYAVHYAPQGSPDFQHYHSLCKEKGQTVHDIFSIDQFPVVKYTDILIEGLWGTGLSRPIEGLGYQVIECINASKATTVSIDIPSGLNTNKDNNYIKVRADMTISFELPKLCFFMAETGPYCGSWKIPSIGLSKEGISKIPATTFLTEPDDFIDCLPQKRRFSHKGDYGRALLMGGSVGMAGAISFAGLSAHALGAGLVHLGVPKALVETLQAIQPESMCLPCGEDSVIDRFPDTIGFDAICFGPGAGNAPETGQALFDLIKENPCPLVIDADGLNLLSSNPEWLQVLPKNTILTPHPGEFRRLAGKSNNSFERAEMAREFAGNHTCILVLKDSYTQIFTPEGDLYINPTGNPVLAHGGSGDVLTGCITGLLARGLEPLDAARLGVYLHGKAADLYAQNTAYQSVLPQELASYLQRAMLELEKDLKNKKHFE